jgi:hypothetical protein
MKKSRNTLLLSLFLDDGLDRAAREQVAARIARDPELRHEYEQLRRMRELLSAREAMPVNPHLPERTMNRIREENREPDAILPVPRRLMPAASGAVALALVALLALAWIQRDQILRYIGSTGEQMQHAYEDTILKGWIMPLFQRTDRDQVLQYAMFGTLPLGDSDGTVLRIDESAERGYRVELAGRGAPSGPPATINELYREIRPTAVQRKIFDTLFLYAQRQIEGAVLMNEAREIAIDPAISTYNQVILSGIAASLEADQLERFESFLEKRNTPYTFVSHRHAPVPPPPPPVPPAELMERFRSMRAPEAFVVLTQDSFTVTQLHLDMDSLRRLMKIVAGRMPRIEMRVQDLARSYAVAGRESGGPPPVEQTGDKRISVPSPPHVPKGVSVGPVWVSEDGHGIAISIDADGEFMKELESEFEELRREITVFKRDNEEHREMLLQRAKSLHQLPLPPRMRDEIRTAAGAGRSKRVTVTVGDDSSMQYRFKIATPDGMDTLDSEEIHIDLRRHIQTAPPVPPMPADPRRQQWEVPRTPDPETNDTIIQI